MRKAYAVVGAGYGDEGKGLTTDWLCRHLIAAGQHPLVVRANGGAQAGHTVQTPQGARHVFKHHGSGTFAGCPTHLSRHFVVNPIGFLEEREQLGRAAGRVSVDPDAMVTLPLDMMLNQWVETQRGSGRHGSCGWGINETITRDTWSPSTILRVRQLPGIGVTELYRYTELYLNHRLTQLGYDPAALSDEWLQRFHDGRVLERFASDCEQLLGGVELVADQEIAAAYPQHTLVFEGAQGLGLDQHGEHFPHVTRSNTGVTNPLEVCESIGVQELEVIYVTRAYATRHGAGPLERERERHAAVVVDPTNAPNTWQGTLRTAPMDLDVLRGRVAADYARQNSIVKTMSVMVTCLDQVPGSTTVYVQGQSLETSGAFIPLLVGTQLLRATGAVRLEKLLMSRGPTHETVSDWYTQEKRLSA